MKVRVTVTLESENGELLYQLEDRLIGGDWTPAEAEDAAERVAAIAAVLAHDALDAVR